MKFHGSTMNDCFGSLIKLILIKAIAMKGKNTSGLMKFPYVEIKFEIFG